MSSVGEHPVLSVAPTLEALPGVLSFDELLREVEATTGGLERGVAVIRCGIGAPLAIDERFVEVMTSAARHSESVVREGAVWAITYTEWPELWGVLEEFAKRDPARIAHHRHALRLRRHPTNHRPAHGRDHRSATRGLHHVVATTPPPRYPPGPDAPGERHWVR
jgi:hypothetical protein